MINTIKKVIEDKVREIGIETITDIASSIDKNEVITIIPNTLFEITNEFILKYWKKDEFIEYEFRIILIDRNNNIYLNEIPNDLSNCRILVTSF